MMKEPLEIIKKDSTEIWVIEKPVEAGFAQPSAGGYRTKPYAKDEAPLRNYWRAVRKRLWVVAGLTALITALAAIYMQRTPNVYMAEALVEVGLENATPALGESKGGSVIVSNPVNDPAYFNTQLRLLTGSALLRRVTKELDLEHNQSFLRTPSAANVSRWQTMWRGATQAPKTGSEEQSDLKDGPATEVLLLGNSSTTTAPSGEQLEESKRLAPYVNSLQNKLVVEPVKETRLPNKETRLINISFTHTDARIAAKVVNTIADTFALSNLERKTETNTIAGDFLQKRIAELQAQIRTGDERLLNYAKNNQILSLDSNQNVVLERLSGLNRQLLEAENDRKLAEATYREALVPGAAEALAGTSSSEISTALNKLADLRERRAQLLVENTNEWTEVKEINQQIAVLEKHAQDTRNRAVSDVVTNLATHYRQALTREKALREAFDRQRRDTITQNEAAINYRILQQEVVTNKNLLEALLQRSKENDLMLAGLASTPNNIRVVDYAIMPESPVGPRRLQVILMALAFSLAAGIGFALLLEYLDNTVNSAEDVENNLGLPALAAIPAVGGLARGRSLPGLGALQRSLSGIGVLQRSLPGLGALHKRNGDGHSTPELLLGEDALSPRSYLAEAYRQLRTSVLLSTAGHPPKSLLVTSSIPSEGKTTTATNMAISLVQTGASVLIVDADMRRPRLHTIFKMENRHGLSTILSSEMKEAEVTEVIEQDKNSGLSVLLSGPIPPNPSELLGSEQMHRLIDILEAKFSHVIIDSPPISSFTDGVLISSMVDGVLMVVSCGKSSRDVVQRSRQLLQDVRAKIIGVVINNVKLVRNDYYAER